MNAGPDVERSIAQWLAEESPGRAPDRILANAASTIDRTKQRRFLAAWREPVTLSMRGIAAVAAVVVVLVAGAAWLGRSTAAVGTPGPTPTVLAPAPSASVVTIASYRDAWGAVCSPLNAQLIALNDAGASFHPATNPADIPRMITNLQQIVALGSTEVQQLGSIEPPRALAAEHAAEVSRRSDSMALLGDAITKLQAGDASAADVLMNATEVIQQSEDAYVRKYGLSDCP